MIVRKTTPEEARRINELFAIAFEQPLQNCPADPENDQVCHWAAFSDSGDMMSSITISDFHIQFDGHVCLMGGIGGVDSLPQYRRMGGIRGCFQAALPDLYAKGYDFSYLYPFSTAYYRKFGFESCVQKYGWEINLSLLGAVPSHGTFRLAEKRNPMTHEIRAVDAVWENRFNLMVHHGDGDYSWTTEADPAVKQEFTYVCFDPEGNPNAYTTFKVANERDGRNLLCSRFCFADKNGFFGLMQLFKSLSTDHAYVKFHTPAIPALQYMLPEWSLGAVKWNLLHNAGMVRIINVRRVLELARYIGSGQLTLEILDPQISENSGRFHLVFVDGKAVSLEDTAAEPDVSMGISTFSALICGVCDFSEARHTFSGLEVRKETNFFHQVFYRKNMMITDYF